jgi:hypothetical protein
LLAQTDECDAKGTKGLKRAEQVGHGSSKTVKPPDGYHVEASFVCVGHKPVQIRPGIFRTAHSIVNVHAYQLPAARFRELLELPRL